MPKNRMFSVFLISLLIFCISCPCVAVGEVITIYTKDEYTEFAKKCTLDSFSKGKTVVLCADIDFKEGKFMSIPIFCGSFDGKGHTLSGICKKDAGSQCGVFRYITKGAEVKNLKVFGSIMPSGSKSFIGGVCGENSGNIENCTFEGNIKGKNDIGGIAGKNTDSGRIINCNTAGSISGESYTGGIAGKNNGYITGCINSAKVNTVYENKKTDFMNIDLDPASAYESFKIKQDENDEDSILGNSDTGGICGENSGVIQGCENRGTIGYEHTGYNVGGIAGRQSGYITGCKNSGAVRGRKDVGGVVGQIEPYVLLSSQSGGLSNLKDEINVLSKMINSFIDDTDSLGKDADLHLANLSEQAKNARNNAKTIIDKGTDFANDNIDEINAQTAVISETFDKLTPVFDDISAAADELADGLYKMSSAIDNADIEIPDIKNASADIKNGISIMTSGERELKKAAKRAGMAAEDIESAVSVNDKTTASHAANALSAAIRDIIGAKQDIKKGAEKIEECLKNSPENADYSEIKTQLDIITESIYTEISALGVIEQSIDTLFLNVNINFENIKDAAQNMEAAVNYLSDSFTSVMKGIEKIGNAVSDIADKAAGASYNDGSDIKKELNDAFSDMSYAARDLKSAFDKLTKINGDIANESDFEFVKISDDVKDASTGLIDSLAFMSDEISDLRKTLNSGRESITQDLKNINNQFTRVMNILTDEVLSLKQDAEEMIMDVSEQDVSGMKQGKVEKCENYGKISADKNVGGVAGNMAIEYAKNFDGEYEMPESINFAYKTKAALCECINDGAVTAFKSCVGGIVGSGETGVILQCENYADITGDGVDYAGGIAGKSEQPIRFCHSKCNVSGKRYVGGIAGKAEEITNCRAIVTISADENMGAVAGGGNKSYIKNNLFTDTGCGGIDNISYSGFAYPVSFEKMTGQQGVPDRFISFKVTFSANGKDVYSQDIKYGDDTRRIKYPPEPEKEGYFGRWKKIPEGRVTGDITVNCVYKQFVTSVASDQKASGGVLPTALADGSFTDNVKMTVEKSNKNAPKGVMRAELFDVKITDDDGYKVKKLRFINNNADKVTVWVAVQDGEWKKVPVSHRGKYVIFDCPSSECTVCLKHTKTTVLPIVLGLLICAAAAAVTIIIRKKQKN